MDIGDISEAPDCRKDKAARFSAHSACLVQDIGDGSGRDVGGLGNIVDSDAHGSVLKLAQTSCFTGSSRGGEAARSIDHQKNLDNAP